MNGDYDVVIVGASFAGLATAMQLRGHRVLLLDQYPVGAHPMSACGTPLATAQAVGAAAATLEVHQALVLHTAGTAIRFNLRDPYITFDYAAFCRAMLAQTDAEFRQLRATELHSNRVMTEQGPVAARFVVNAAGWRLQASQGVAASDMAGYGLETELPRPEAGALGARLPHLSGLHFYFEKRVVANGYAWVFPCGDRVRIGVGSFTPNVKLRPRLEAFLNRFDLRAQWAPGETHGGVLAIRQTEPLVADVFCVGDAAGQCLPVTGEGIRTAIFHGIHCGRAIAGALAGRCTPEEAAALYRDQAHSMDRFHGRLLKLQRLVAHTPEFLLAWAGHICAARPLTWRIMHKYLTDSGWFLGQSTQP